MKKKYDGEKTGFEYVKYVSKYIHKSIYLYKYVLKII